MEMTDFEMQWWIENNIPTQEMTNTYCPDCEIEVALFGDKIMITSNELIDLLKKFRDLK